MLNGFMGWLGFSSGENKIISWEEMQQIHCEEKLIALIENKQSTLEDLTSLIEQGKAVNLNRLYSPLENPATTLLHLTLYKKRWDLAIALIQLGADPAIQDREGKNALSIFFAQKPTESEWNKEEKAYFDNFDIMLKLTSLPIINLPNHEGKTLLHLAANQKPYFITSLLEKGADPNLQDYAGNTAFYYYLAHYFDSDLKKEEKYFVLRTLLHKMDKESINFVNNDGKTALYDFLMTHVCDKATIIDGETIEAILKILKEKGFLFNAQDSAGNTLLHNLAISRSYVEKSVNEHKLVQTGKILKTYCDATLPNNYDFTAADIADIMGNRRFAGMLNRGKKTKFQVWEDHRRAFLHNRFNLQSDKAWNTIIQRTLGQWTKGNTNTSIADVILCTMLEYVSEAAEDLKQAILVNPSYLLFALIKEKASLALIKALLEHGIIGDLQIIDEHGDAILHQLIQQLKALFETLQGTNTSISTSALIKDSLFLPKFEWFKQMFEILLHYGVDPNAKNLQGETALHQLAALQNTTHNPYFARCQSIMAAILRDNGAQLELQNNQGETALQIAESVQQGKRMSKDTDIIDTLQEKNYMDRLPTEILRKIIHEFTLQDVKLVSSRFYGISNDWHLWLNYHVVAAYAKPLKEYCHYMFKGLKEKNKTIQEANKEICTHLRKVIQEMPYIIKMEYLQKYFPDNYQYLKNQVEAKKNEEAKKQYLYQRVRRDILIDNLLILADPPYRELLFKNGSVYLNEFISYISESAESEEVTISIPSGGCENISENPENIRKIFLCLLHNSELWEIFIEELKEIMREGQEFFQGLNYRPGIGRAILPSEIYGEIDMQSLLQVMTKKASHILFDEEVILSFLQHQDFRDILLKENEFADRWFKYIFNLSINSNFKSYHRYYQLFGSDRLASALFIIQHKEYSHYLEKALRENPNSLKKITKRLEEIKNNSSVKQETQERATQILKIINTWNAKNHIENLPSTTLGNRS